MTMTTLAISGSLRASSSNTSVLQALAALAPAGVDVPIYRGLGDLPHFNPDLDTDDPPPAVADFRARLRAADGLILSSPEYAHGVPGAPKNALDWVVGSGELVDKPVLLINTSPRATHAQASLRETLKVMTATLAPYGPTVVHLRGGPITAEAIIQDSGLADTLYLAVAHFVRDIVRGLEPEP